VGSDGAGAVTAGPDIFLSYNREDQATAQRFAEAFEQEGFSVWWDATLRSGEAYDQVTEEALRGAKAVVVLWSRKSVISRWVRAEATLADRNRSLVPARIEACDLPIMFELTQTADLSRWTGTASDPAWRLFLADVRRFVGNVSQQPSPTPQADPASASRAGKPAIAILPFVNRSGLSEDDIFADDMVEDISTALSSRPKAKVVSSRASAGYRNKAWNPREVGRELGVSYLLEGNVRRIGEDLRVTAQLVEAESGNILWTQTFDRPLSEIAALQDALVSEVAGHLTAQVEMAEQAQALGKAGNFTAREAIVRANAISGGYGTSTGREVAIVEAKRAVTINPNDAVAYSTLASLQAHLLHCRGGDDAVLRQEIADNIARARAIDPYNPDVVIGLAITSVWAGKIQDALLLAERAVAEHPGFDNAHFALGMALTMLGRSDEAISELAAVEQLAPSSTWGHWCALWQSFAHLRAGRLDRAAKEIERAQHIMLNGESLVQAMLCRALQDDWAGAHEALHQLHEIEPSMSGAVVAYQIRYIYGQSDATADYVATVRKLWDEHASESGPA
jgi:TolB-like protein